MTARQSQSQSSSSSPPPPIERLLIFHLDLARACTGSAALDETASSAELLEAVLFHYTSCSPHRQQQQQQQQQEDDDTVIAFLGLCTALYQLPASFAQHDDQDDDDDGDDDPVHTVHLSSSSSSSTCLVFVQLEDPAILAVAQTATSAAATTSPSAVRRALQRSHQLFGVLRGGGIERRLRQTVPNGIAAEGDDLEYRGTRTTENNSNSNDAAAAAAACIYPGMDQLYRLRKQLRQVQLQHSHHQHDNNDNNENNEQSVLQLQRAVADLARRLPIAAVRHDLAVHYEAFLGEQQEHLHSYRNIVEGLPQPILPRGEDVICCAPQPAIGPDTLKQVAAAVERLMKEGGDVASNVIHSPDPLAAADRCEPRLLGISTFFQGRICLPTQTIFPKYNLSNDTAAALLWYMSRFRSSNSSTTAPALESSARGNASTPPRLHRSNLKPFALQFTSDSPPSEHDAPAPAATAAGFLAPPPLSFLSSLDEANAFAGPSTSTTVDSSSGGSINAQQVWCPPVCLSLEQSETDATARSRTTTKHHMDARACLYSRGDFSFLLYLTCPSSMLPATDVANEDPIESSFSTLYQKLLLSVKTVLETAVPLTSAEDDESSFGNNAGKANDSSVDGNCTYVGRNQWQRAGHEVISIDRRNNSLVLYSDSRSSTHENIKNKRKGASNNLKDLFGSLNNLKKAGEQQNIQSPPSSGGAVGLSNAALLGLDCRYQLASHLSHDTILAFEDAFDEVQQFRQQQQSSRHDHSETVATSTNVFEMCTLLATRWVYAFAQGQQELYILFDPAFFVTVADVQNAASEIRKELVVD